LLCGLSYVMNGSLTIIHETKNDSSAVIICKTIIDPYNQNAAYTVQNSVLLQTLFSSGVIARDICNKTHYKSSTTALPVNFRTVKHVSAEQDLNSKVSLFTCFQISNCILCNTDNHKSRMRSGTILSHQQLYRLSIDWHMEQPTSQSL
jgi:hypothetical protein